MVCLGDDDDDDPMETVLICFDMHLYWRLLWSGCLKALLYKPVEREREERGVCCCPGDGAAHLFVGLGCVIYLEEGY